MENYFTEGLLKRPENITDRLTLSRRKNMKGWSATNDCNGTKLLDSNNATAGKKVSMFNIYVHVKTSVNC